MTAPARRCRSAPGGCRRCTACRPAQGPAAAGHHRQCRAAARADPVPHPRKCARAEARRGDRPRKPGRAAARQGYIAHRYRGRCRRICGARVDLRYLPGGLEGGLRLDFFGDEIESLRLFDPAAQRTTGRCWTATCCCPPAKRCWMRTASSASAPAIAKPSAPPPRRSAVSRRSATGGGWPGMEHWLPLFEDRLATLFDHLSRR